MGKPFAIVAHKIDGVVELVKWFHGAVVEQHGISTLDFVVGPAAAATLVVVFVVVDKSVATATAVADIAAAQLVQPLLWLLLLAGVLTRQLFSLLLAFGAILILLGVAVASVLQPVVVVLRPLVASSKHLLAFLLQRPVQPFQQPCVVLQLLRPLSAVPLFAVLRPPVVVVVQHVTQFVGGALLVVLSLLVPGVFLPPPLVVVPLLAFVVARRLVQPLVCVLRLQFLRRVVAMEQVRSWY